MNALSDQVAAVPGRTSDRTVDPAELGTWFFLATVTMLFAAFASSYLIRRTSSDWTPIALPTVLWVNTLVLIASSVALDRAKSLVSRKRRDAAARAIGVSVGLGLAFVGGQALGWNGLVEQGVFLPTSPHASFFYLLTGLHALHVGAGLVLLVVTRSRVTSDLEQPEAARWMRIAGSYWHFMGGLWIFLFLLLALL